MADVTDILNIDQIKRLIPHRAPILLIDRVENIIPDTEATGIKAVSGNEPYFVGHFPDFPVMPGVLIVEAGKQIYAASADSAKAPRRRRYTAPVPGAHRSNQETTPG